MEIYLLSSVNFIIYLLQILSLNINLVTQQNGYRHYHLPLHVKIHAEIKWLYSVEKKTETLKYLTQDLSIATSQDLTINQL